MKQCSQTLANYLATNSKLNMCDLYEFRLGNGIVLRYADYDRDVIAGGNTYLMNGPVFSRAKISLKLGGSVDTMSLSAYVNDKDSIADKTFMQAACLGAFDDGSLSLYQCYFYDDGSVVDYVLIFKGEMEVKSGGGLKLTFDVKSSVQRLNVEYPLRSYYVECPYSVYDACCGVNINSYKRKNSVASGSTATIIKLSTAVTASYYDNGGIIFTSGNLKGVTMPIKTNTANQLTLMTELVGVPTAGDTFQIYPGCDKTDGMCKSRFNNSARNRSTPYVPLPETIV